MTTRKRGQAAAKTPPVSSAQDWAALIAAQDVTETVQLPESKLYVRLRRPDVLAMMLEDGSLPDSLSGRIATVIDNTGAAQATQDNPQLTAADLAKLKPLLDRVCVESFVEPRIGLALDIERKIIPLSAVSLVDRLAVFNWCLKGKASRMAAFPQGQSQGSVHPLLHGKRLRAKT